MEVKRKVVLYIAMSLDGYIAKPKDDLSFLSLVERDNEDYGYAEFLNTIDTVILGRRTYEWVLNKIHTNPHADKTMYVYTRTETPNEGKTIFYTGDLTHLIRQLQAEKGKNIFIDGGAELVNKLLTLQLIDEFIISIIPIFLGNGIRLFEDKQPEKILELVNSKPFASGLVQLHYRLK